MCIIVWCSIVYLCIFLYILFVFLLRCLCEKDAINVSIELYLNRKFEKIFFVSVQVAVLRYTVNMRTNFAESPYISVFC